MCNEDANFDIFKMNIYSFVEISNTERCILMFMHIELSDDLLSH